MATVIPTKVPSPLIAQHSGSARHAEAAIGGYTGDAAARLSHDSGGSLVAIATRERGISTC
jgi:hypothetical protein